MIIIRKNTPFTFTRMMKAEKVEDGMLSEHATQHIYTKVG